MSRRRVVVTGLGMVSPLGLTVEDTWQAIVAGKSGVTRVESFDVTGYYSQISASVKNFDPSVYLDVKEVRKMDVFIQYGMASSIQAIQDAGLEISESEADRVGVAMGSGIGGLPFIEANKQAVLEKGPRRISPYFIPGAIINLISGNLSIRYGYKGPNIAIVTACTTGSHNIGYAARNIIHGDADIMIAGGAEMATCQLGLGGFGAMRALSSRNDDPERASRPWDTDRDGFVLGDGAGTVVLEEYEHAKKRGAKIYAELVGFGQSADAHHMTMLHPEGRGSIAAMQNALNDASCKAEDIDYINAHATSTPGGDGIEALAVSKLFGSGDFAVSSTKSMTGHLLGAAGAVEAIFTILALRDQVVPPTINLDKPSEDWNLNFVPHTAQERSVNYALSNSFGFGGTNGSLLFKKI